MSLQLETQGWCRLQPGKAKAAVSASQRHHRTKNFWVPFSSSPSRPTSERAEEITELGKEDVQTKEKEEEVFGMEATSPAASGGLLRELSGA